MQARALATVLALGLAARDGVAQQVNGDVSAVPARAVWAVSAPVILADPSVPRHPPSLLAPTPVGVALSLTGAGTHRPTLLPLSRRGSGNADNGDRSLQPVQVQREARPWLAPLASAIVPGAGQGLLGQDRALAYVAVEAYGWLRYASDIREGQRQRRGYRRLAARVARAYLSDVRPSGDFEYYERMEHYIESGVFDSSPAEGLQPEPNPESFNGFIWLRARTTFWEDPAIPPPATSEPYSAALEYYAERAIQPEFRWSWRNAQLEQDLFRRTIGRSNDAFRRSIQDLGVIIANHALSTVDAYVTVRIRHARQASGGVGLEASIPWSPRRPSFGTRDPQ